VLGVSVLGIADEDDINTWNAAHRLQPLDVTVEYTRRKRGRKRS